MTSPKASQSGSLGSSAAGVDMEEPRAMGLGEGAQAELSWAGRVSPAWWRESALWELSQARPDLLLSPFHLLLLPTHHAGKHQRLNKYRALLLDFQP